MTHREWNAVIKRALDLAPKRPASALRTLRALARKVEASLETGVHEWHLGQTLYVISLVQAAAGDPGGAADTLMRLVDEQHAELNYEVRAYVSASAAAALQLAHAGDPRSAKRVLRKAERWSKLLRPKDKLTETAFKVVRAQPAGRSKRRTR